MRLVKIFKSGLFYLHLCPDEKSLAYSFPEIKMIKAIKLAKKYLPLFVIGLFAWQYYMSAELAITVITALFALSLPIQGIFWLGKRALSPLPLTLVSWYNEITKQLVIKKVIAEKELEHKQLNFIDFMKMLNLAKIHFGNYTGNQDDDIN